MTWEIAFTLATVRVALSLFVAEWSRIDPVAHPAPCVVVAVISPYLNNTALVAVSRG